MKILSIDKIRKGDEYTIANEPIESIDLMERASTQCALWFQENYDSNIAFSVFAGIGNNGGDGLAIARILYGFGYSVKVFITEYSKNYSVDFAINLERLKEVNVELLILSKANNDFEIADNEIVIDAMFGSGLSREITGFTSEIVNRLNFSKNKIVSIDIPSGLMGDVLPANENLVIIQAQHTLSIAFPKKVFFLQEAASYIGYWHHIDIGIHPKFIAEVEADGYYLQQNDIKVLIQNRSKFSHKGTYGHALLIVGSYSKMGAAVLASKAAHRSGIGLLTTHVPSSAVDIMQTSSHETMLSIDNNAEYFTMTNDLSYYNAIGIGPGLGMRSQSQNALKLLIQNISSPMVIDADALNILSENKTWLSFLPAGSILTPHPKEFERLVGKTSNAQQRIELQCEFSVKHQLIVVLKGANTSISTPDGKLFFNSTGNPGMATAGSGDVLTGIILSLLAQKYPPQSAAVLGVFIHGLAGDIAALENGFEALIASDIIDNLGKAFLRLV